MIRIAAIGDIHFAEDSSGKLRDHWKDLSRDADVFLLCGDLTNLGRPSQASALAEELRSVEIPMVAVLGNHDHHAGSASEVRRILESIGVTLLEGESHILEVRGSTLGIAGTKGFGGGFVGACGHAFGEDVMKEFMHATESSAHVLEDLLRQLDAEFRIGLLHYSPVRETLEGERLEIYPFLGSYRLAEALDNAGADLAIHGHAHHGSEKGSTPGGIPVRNVAMPLLRRPYAIYSLGEDAPHPRFLSMRRSASSAAAAGSPARDRRQEGSDRPRSRGRHEVYLPEKLEEFVSREQWDVYRNVVHEVHDRKVSFALGGGIAVSFYTGHWRNSKDMDFYVHPGNREVLIRATSRAGFHDYHAELPYDRRWIYRAARDGLILDIIWSLANGAGVVDDHWLTGDSRVDLFGDSIPLVPPEELIWSKIHIVQRDRSDWPDILNLLFTTGPSLDWDRLLGRLEGNHALLGSVLGLFTWLAPGRARALPHQVLDAVGLERPPAGAPLVNEDHVRRIDSRPWFTPVRMLETVDAV